MVGGRGTERHGGEKGEGMGRWWERRVRGRGEGGRGGEGG